MSAEIKIGAKQQFKHELYSAMAKCEQWKNYGACRHFNGDTCVHLPQCPVVQNYERLCVKLLKAGVSMPYLPGRFPRLAPKKTGSIFSS